MLLSAESRHPFGQWVAWTRIPDVTLRWGPLDAGAKIAEGLAAEDLAAKEAGDAEARKAAAAEMRAWRGAAQVHESIG